jgi:hypothetical protein
MTQPHEKRVIDEKGGLDDKTRKLSAFMHTEIFAGLASMDQGLLMVQIRQMREYSKTLSDRIERFN